MKHYFKPYLDCKIFIETGSAEGVGITAALNAGFETIYSIELSSHYYDVCRELFHDYPQIKLFQGNSIKWLPRILSGVNERCVFWIDAHWCGGETAGRGFQVPIMDELRIIAEHHIKEHTILIDDMRMIRDNAELEWQVAKIEEEQIKELLYSINPNYKITYEHVGGAKIFYNEIMIARI